MHPPFSFPSCGKENGPCTVQKKRPLGRAPVQWPSARNGGRRIGACSDLDWPSGTLCSSAIPVAAVPWRMAPTSSGWLSHGAASLFATAHAPAKNPAARSAAERAEREADQMRPCTPLTFAPAPRESAFKPVPHPAAPVGRSSQTRRHHLSSTPVQQLCTDVQSCDQKRFFSSTGRGAFSFCQEQKENGGRIPRGNGPLAGASLPGRLISASTPPPEAFPALKRETSPERSQSYTLCRTRSSSKAPAPTI